MMHYWRVFTQNIKISLADTLIYRTDIISNLVLGIVWAMISLVFVEVIYLHTDSFVGWSKSEIILLLLTFQISTEIATSLGGSLYQFSNYIRTGNFDFFLIRPIDPQFISVFGKPDFKNLLYAGTNTLPYIYLLVKNPVPFNLIDIPLYIYYVLLANILWISIQTIAVTCNFWWQKLDNLPNLLYSITSLGKYPTAMFPRKIQALFHTFLPIAFIAVIPTQALQGKTTIPHLLLGTLIVAFSVTFSRIFWNFAIKNYASASS